MSLSIYAFYDSVCRVVDDVSIKLGSIVSGVVERLTPGAVIIQVKANGYMKGTMYNEHLSDHQGNFFLVLICFMMFFCLLCDGVQLISCSYFSGHASLMKSLLKPGYEFDELLVLGRSTFFLKIYECLS